MVVSTMSSEAGAAGENSATRAAAELNVVNVLGLNMVLKIGRLIFSVCSLTNDTLYFALIYSLNHTLQHGLVLLKA